MKKIITFLFTTAMAITLLISCKKDDAPPTIVGKWSATKDFTYEYINGVEVSGDTTIYNADNKLLVTFSANNTGVVYDIENGNNFSENFTYNTVGNNLTINFQNDTTHSTFSVTPNELFVSAGEEKEIEQGKFKWESTTFFTRQ
jgi:hypothetical protein